MGICGALRGAELVNMRTNDISKQGDWLVVDVPKTKTDLPRRFIVSDEFVDYVTRYRNLRPTKVTTDRFFLTYRNGQCTVQPIGKNTFAKMPYKIAQYLGLPNPTSYTGHAFRRTSATLLANCGASMTTLKRHGGWKSSTVAEGYIAESMENKAKTGKIIFHTVSSSDIQQEHVTPLKQIENNNDPLALIMSDENSAANDTSNAEDKRYKFENCEVIINNWK